MFVHESRMKTSELCPHITRSYFICKYIFQKHSELSRPALNKRSFFSVFILLCQILFYLDWNSAIMNTEPSNGGFNRFLDFGDIKKEMTEVR